MYIYVYVCMSGGPNKSGKEAPCKYHSRTMQ